MYFCSGPPRTYALPADAASSTAASASTRLHAQRVEDVALAVDPLQRVVARVTDAAVSLWTCSARARRLHAQRLLVVVPRGGRFLTSAQRAREALPPVDGVADGGCDDVQQLFAVWVAGDRLAVVERGSQVVEFYAFDGLPATGAVLDPLNGAADRELSTDAAPLSPTAKVSVHGRFLDEYAVNVGESNRDREDVAWSMSAVAGGRNLFVGMESGLICVVQVSGSSDKVVERLWKIDVVAHLGPASPTATRDPLAKPSCYNLTAASADSSPQLVLVACFEGGKCFILLLTPASKTIDQLLSLVNTERDNAAVAAAAAASASLTGSCFGRCTIAALDTSGTRLALGWSDGGVSLFRLGIQRTTDKPPQLQLRLEPLRELSMAPWGYTTRDIGGVTTLAWTQDARALAVGYELRGFAVFSTDGCRLMSSLPQHNHERPTASSAGTDGDDAFKEVCVNGALRLAWSVESSSLIVVARGQSFEVPVPVDPTAEATTSEAVEPTETESESATVPELRAEDLFERVEVPLLKEADGLCLSLSGAPGRCGAWVRSDSSFTRRRDGGVGPAEASQQIEGGDLLLAINDNNDVVNWPFEQIIQEIKALPDQERVTLVFLRLKWETVYGLATRALASRAFLVQHDIQPLLDEDEEDLCIREYALRMQERHGDCDLDERPPLLEFEKRAKFDGWEAIQGTTQSAARHKYIKLLFAVFPEWNPLQVLQALAAFVPEQVDTQAEDEYLQLRRLNSSPRSGQRRSVDLDNEPSEPTPVPMERRRRASRLAFAEYDFARSVPLANRTSKLVLIEDASIRRLSSPSLDDPCALVSAQSWSVPAEFDAKCCPLRLVAVSVSGQQVAVAGQRGFCVLNLTTGKWRLFGNVHDEQDLFVHALLWVQEDIILVSFTRFREQHSVLHVVAYPRNHLDEASILASLDFPRNPKDDSNSHVVMAMESDDDDRNVFCLLRCELWCLGIEYSGSLGKQGADELKATLTVKRQVRLPSSVYDAAVSPTRIYDFTAIPRVLHIQTEAEASRRKKNTEDEESGGWFSTLVNMIAGGEVPDQYKPEEVLPRFAFLTADGHVIVWDPENRSQRLLCSNVTTMTRLFVTHEACASWPTPCRLMYGLYGPEGMKLWLPLLDGVYMAHTKAFEDDSSRLETFLACHDPLRAKTYEIEFGTAPATAELYEHVVNEYGIVLEAFVASTGSRQLEEGVTNLRGCITTIDDAASRDLMLRFDADVTLLGMQQVFGLLVGISQDVYMPPGAGLTLPCYDVFSRVQPFFHSVLCLLVRNNQLTWARHILTALRGNHYALSSPTQELFLHAMLEACFNKQIPQAKLEQAIQLLQPQAASEAGDHHTTATGDMDEYCEIVAHVARKSEPSRLKLLFPAAGDPTELLAVCRQRGELRTAANFLLILEECSSAVDDGEGDDGAAIPTPTLAFRSACAAELVAQCIEQDEWALAKHVVRVAREWIDEQDQTHETSYIDEQLGKFCWQDLVSGRFERVVWCIEELQAVLPQLDGLDMGIVDTEKEQITQRLHDAFVQAGNLNGLHVLLQAVTHAQYADWTLVVQRVIAMADEAAAAVVASSE